METPEQQEGEGNNQRNTAPDTESVAFKTLGKESPFKTILYSSGGPFLAELTGAAYGILETYWIAKFAEKEGNAAMSLVSLMDTLIRAFGYFMSSASSSRLSYLRGEGHQEKVI